MTLYPLYVKKRQLLFLTAENENQCPSLLRYTYFVICASLDITNSKWLHLRQIHSTVTLRPYYCLKMCHLRQLALVFCILKQLKYLNNCLVKSYSDIHSPLSMNSVDSGNPQTSPLAPPKGQTVFIICQMDHHEICYRPYEDLYQGGYRGPW